MEALAQARLARQKEVDAQRKTLVRSKDTHVARRPSTKSYDKSEHRGTKKVRRSSKYADEAEEDNDAEEEETSETEDEEVWPANLSEDLKDEPMGKSKKSSKPPRREPSPAPLDMSTDDASDSDFGGSGSGSGSSSSEEEYARRIDLGKTDTEESESDLSEHEDIVIKVPKKERLYHGYTRAQILAAWAKVSLDKPRAKYSTDTKEDILSRTAKQMIAQGRLSPPPRAAKKRPIKSRSEESSPEPPLVRQSQVAATPPTKAAPTSAPGAPRKKSVKATRAETLEQVLERLRPDPAFPWVVSKVPKNLKDAYMLFIRNMLLSPSLGHPIPEISVAAGVCNIVAELSKIRDAALKLGLQVQIPEAESTEPVPGHLFLGTMDESGPVLAMNTKPITDTTDLRDLDYAKCWPSLPNNRPMLLKNGPLVNVV